MSFEPSDSRRLDAPGVRIGEDTRATFLYDTSNILHRFPEDRYVGASLQLFASVALMFWYVLQLFMSRR